jgi:thiaminase/transcriptional activator TenA
LEKINGKNMTFSKNAWKLISPIYKSILIHPFNLELTKGTLSKEKFQFYIQQDSIYLIDFARALAITASRANNPEDLVLLLDFSKGAVIAERELHEFYLDLYKINLKIEKAPGCFAYTHFLISKATNSSYEEALAALLPCFWIYQEVGQYIYKNSIKDNPYQKWIDTYSGEEFQNIVESAIALTNRAAEKANKDQLSLMKEAFLTSTRLELAFWDSAYKMESWKN